jgi:hypothetical protein
MALVFGVIAFSYALMSPDVEVRFDAEACERIMEQIVGAAVQVIGRYDLIARLNDIKQRQGYRRSAACSSKSTCAAVKRCNTLFQHVRSRIC